MTSVSVFLWDSCVCENVCISLFVFLYFVFVLSYCNMFVLFYFIVLLPLRYLFIFQGKTEIMWIMLGGEVRRNGSNWGRENAIRIYCMKKFYF